MPPTKTYQVGLAGCMSSLLSLNVREGEGERGEREGGPRKKNCSENKSDTDVAATFLTPLRHVPLPHS